MDQMLSEGDAQILGAFGTLDALPLLWLRSLLVEVAGNEIREER